VNATASTTWRTPPQLAAELGCDVSKVLGWIHRGELRAFDLSERKGERARFKILADDWAEFLRRRQVSPPVPRQRRRKRITSSIPQYV